MKLRTQRTMFFDFVKMYFFRFVLDAFVRSLSCLVFLSVNRFRCWAGRGRACVRACVCVCVSPTCLHACMHLSFLVSAICFISFVCFCH